jgi:DNA polymerase-3 subunit delta
MKLASYQFKNLLNSGAKGARSILFYGEEDLFFLDKVTAFSQQCLNTKPSELSTASSDKITSKDIFLKDLVGEKMLWEEEKKAIWLQGATEKTLPFIKEFLEQEESSFLIVTAEKYLKPASKMRQYYEQERSLLSLGCFAPTADELKQKIKILFDQNQKTIALPLLAKLSDIFLRSPLVLEKEIEKLILYAKEKSEINEQDIEACIFVDEALAYDDLIDSFFDQKAKKALHFFQVQIDEGGSSIGSLRMLLSQARRLYALKCSQLEGRTLDQAFLSVSPPVFAHQKEKIKRYLEKWSSKDLEILLEDLMQVEIGCKGSSDLTTSLFERLLLSHVH